jgi:hypothetical protein
MRPSCCHAGVNLLPVDRFLVGSSSIVLTLEPAKPASPKRFGLYPIRDFNPCLSLVATLPQAFEVYGTLSSPGIKRDNEIGYVEYQSPREVIPPAPLRKETYATSTEWPLCANSGLSARPWRMGPFRQFAALAVDHATGGQPQVRTPAPVDARSRGLRHQFGP